MFVWELIALLRDCDGDKRVVIDHPDGGGYYDIEGLDVRDDTVAIEPVGPT